LRCDKTAHQDPNLLVAGWDHFFCMENFYTKNIFGLYVLESVLILRQMTVLLADGR